MEMDLNKCVIKGEYESEFYCKKNEVVNQKNYVLLGFKNNLPVLSNKMPEAILSNGIIPKKTLKLEVDAQTGEKFLHLNGKKLKMVNESELPLHLKRNAHIIKSNSNNGPLTKKPMKIKIIGSMSPSVLHSSSMLIKTAEPKNVDKLVCKPNVNNTDKHVGDSKLSPITKLIKNTKLPTVLSSVGNIIEACSTVSENTGVKQNNELRKVLCAPVKIKLDPTQTSELKTYQVPINMKALDLTKLGKQKIYTNLCNVDAKSFDNKYVQTDDKITVSQSVQTEEALSLLDLNFDLCDYVNSPATPVPHDVLTDTADKMIDMPTRTMKIQQSDRISMFFNDLRSALIPDDKGNMPIHIGVLTNNINLVRRNCSILKALQKTVDLPNYEGLSALQLAVINDSNPEMINILLENGARLDVTDPEGNNVVHLAAEFNRQQLLEIILMTVIQQDFDLNQFNAEGFTPLMICCSNGLYNCADLLLGHGADINVRDRKSGRTALFHAAEKYDTEMVNLLLGYNANTKIKNFFGTSPHDAMYEVEDIPEGIKTQILRKNTKRKVADEPKLTKIKKKDYAKKPLKTYARFKKIEDYEFPKKVKTLAK